MTKIIVVSSCGECPYSKTHMWPNHQIDYRCQNYPKIFVNGFPEQIPDWCPLKEQGKPSVDEEFVRLWIQRWFSTMGAEEYVRGILRELGFKVEK